MYLILICLLYGTVYISFGLYNHALYVSYYIFHFKNLLSDMNSKININRFSVLFSVQAKGLDVLSLIIRYRCAEYRLKCLN